uniref:NERD domain-containing protein n=1 Tax=Lachnospira eligens TaxID=39485 RepID=UPI004028B84F
MELFQKKIGPVFLKEDSDATVFIDKMHQLESKATSPELKQEIQKQIKLASYGAIGEQNIAYELKNSGMDMYILHDICLEHEDLTAQIDYIIITRKKIFIIECKNLIGNIEIDSQGNFIRTYEMFGKKVKEGIYSPVTQNQRHLNVLKACRKEAKGNFITKMAFEHYFDDNHKSLIVLANPKTYFNYRFAPKELKNTVIRADQLVATIKKLNSESKDPSYTEKEMRELADFYLNANKPDCSDYSKKYEEMLIEVENTQNIEQQDNSNIDVKAIESPNTTISYNTDEKSTNTSTNSESSNKTCPKCGSKLILRKASKGNNAGKSFWGCSAFPKCRYTKIA